MDPSVNTGNWEPSGSTYKTMCIGIHTNIQNWGPTDTDRELGT